MITKKKAYNMFSPGCASLFNSKLLIRSLAVVLLVAIALTGCGSAAEEEPRPAVDPHETIDEERGNSPGNNVNGAWIIKTEGSYFISSLSISEDGYVWPLQRVDEDYFLETGLIGTDYHKLEGNVSGINAAAGRLYYTNWMDNKYLYKINYDGSERTRLNRDASWRPHLVDGWLYYLNGDDDDRIYRLRTDGSGRARLSEFSSSCFNVTGGWIYFCNVDENEAIFKMRYDGSDLTRLNEDRSKMINVYEQKIYYINQDDGRGIYVINADGTARTALSADKAYALNVDAGWIYYSIMEGSGIYRIRLDGTDRTLLTDEDAFIYDARAINIVNGWIYFQTGEAFIDYHRLRTDGSDYQLLFWEFAHEDKQTDHSDETATVEELIFTKEAKEVDASLEEAVMSAMQARIKEFLCCGEVLSTSDMVGSAYPELFYFTENGTYAYRSSQYGVRQEDQLLTQRGEWSLLGNVLILDVLEETRAVGGEKTSDPIMGEIITGYETVHTAEHYRMIYKVSFAEDEYGRVHLVWNDQPIYVLFIPEEDIIPLKKMAGG